MATYLELAEIASDPGYGDWIKKIVIAVSNKAHSISQLSPPTAEQIQWAKEALTKPNEKRKQIENYILAEFGDTNTIAQIIAVTDAQLQTGVDNAVDLLLSL